MPAPENAATYRKRKEEEERAARLRAQTAPDRRPAPVKVKVKPKPKAPPLPVPSLTIEYEKPPAKPKRPPRVAVGPEPRAPHGGNLPTEFEYLSPTQLLARMTGTETAAERRQVKQQNQWRERKRRDAVAAEKAARDQRREIIRSLDVDARNMIGRDKLQRFIETGEGLRPGITDIIGKAAGGYLSSLLSDPLRPARDIYSAADWWISGKGGEAVVGKYEKGKGYQGGLAETWDAMSTQEQIDTIVGGKSLGNVLQGQGLNPANIGRAVALAALAPIPWGRGLPSLASVLLRAGHSAPEVTQMLKTGKGLAEALQATKRPIQPLKRAGKALKGKGASPVQRTQRVSALTHPRAADAETIKTWKPDAQRVAGYALARATQMPVVALRDAQGTIRSIAAYEIQGDMLVIRDLAGAGKGGGKAMMREMAREASAQNLGIRLVAETEDAAGFYRHLGMSPLGKKGFVWEPEEAARFAAGLDDVPTQLALEAPPARGQLHPSFVETTDAAAFNAALRENPRLPFITEHSPEEFAKSRAFIDPEAKAGFMLSPEGDLQNVFRNPGGRKGAGAQAVEHAIASGAKTLDAYEGPLTDLYASKGFVETGRMKWNDEFAPKGWDYVRDGRPDVVFMAYGAKPSAARYFKDWDEAKRVATEAADEIGGAAVPAGEPQDIPVPQVFRFTRDEAEELPLGGKEAGYWYHGTTSANAEEIERTGVLKVGERSAPPGAWLTANPRHAATFGDTVIMIPESFIPAEAERIRAFGGMVNSPIDVVLQKVDDGLAEGGEAVAKRAITPVSRDIAAEIQASGLPLPPELTEPEDLARAIEDVFEMAEDGAFGKDWYKGAAEQVMIVSNHLGLPPLQVAQLFAIFSQAADTVANATFVFDAARQFQKWDDLFSGRFPTAQSPEALAVLQGGTWEGRKRSSFYANILRHLPGMDDEYNMVIKAMAEARGAPINHPVTVDRWVVRMFRPNAKKDVPEKFYDTFETIMQRMAAAKGWEPEQIQAAAWVSMKTRNLEKELAKKGRKTVRHLAGGGDYFNYGVQRQLDLEAQGALFKGLETTPQARRLANQVNRKWGGFTVNRDMTPVPETGYSVTYSLTEEAYPLHKIKAADIEQFAERHKKLLRDSRNKIGGFSDDANPTGDGTGVSYLSVTRHFPSDSAQSRAAALRFAREQGQETVYEYKSGNGIRTGLSREEQREIIQGLDPVKGPQALLPPTSIESEYKRYLDDVVRGSGKGKKGVTVKQRGDAERDMLKMAERYPDDPDLDEFRRLYAEVHHAPEAETEIPWGEAGGLNPAGLFRQPVPDRTVRYGDRVQHFPGARSHFTRSFIERPADWTSEQLLKEDALAAKILNRLMPTASARKRVPKQAGMDLKQDAIRAEAQMSEHINRLPDAGDAEDVAHFYWAQLPSDLRNERGLLLVRQEQMREADFIASGGAQAQLEEEIAAVKARLAETKDVSLLGELEDLRLLVSDIPNRLEDLTVSIASLDKLIRKPPVYDQEIVDAMSALALDRERILGAAGKLDAEEAADRKGLLSRWLGLEPTGEEIYVGHRLGKVRGAQPGLMPVTVGTGRPRTPLGVGQKNKLVLARSGRLRPSTHVVGEDWRAAQTYQTHLVARDTLADMGTEFKGRLPKNTRLVNRKGRVIPKAWTTDYLNSVADLEDDELRAAAEEILGGFMVKSGDDYETFAREALEAGANLSDLRVVPEDVVQRFYGQFTPPKGASRPGKVYDAAVDFTAASIVFARVGYIPKNIAQNLIMAVPHQGPFLLLNVPRAVQALAHPELRHLLHAEIGFGGARQLGEELRYGNRLRGLPGGAASLVGKIADDPMRISAFIHEAAAAGVIRRYSAHLSDSEMHALISFMKGKGHRTKLNAVRSRAVEAMGNFSRLTPTQSRWARRFLIIPGWLWAGSRYPFHFAATHPGRSAAMAYVAAGEPYGDRIGLPQNPPVSDLFAEGLPQFIEGIRLPDEFPIFGGKTFRTTSLSPVSTPYDIALALAGQSPDTAYSYANPLAKSLTNIAARRVEYPGGSYSAGYQEAILRNLERLVPNVTFVMQEVSPGGAAGRYPDDETRLGRFFRELGVVPIAIRSAEEQDMDEWVKETETLTGQPMPDYVKGWRKVYQAYTKTVREFEDKTGISTSYNPQARLAALELTVATLNPDRKAEAQSRANAAFALDDDDAEERIKMIRGKLGLTSYDSLQTKLGKARAEAQSHSGMRPAGQH